MRYLLISALLLSQVSALAAIPTTDSQAASSASAQQELDEVVVEGRSLGELRVAVISAEDRFFNRYNEINKIDDFDIDCFMDRHTGTQRKYRHCRTNLEIRVRAEEASDIMNQLQRAADIIGNTAPTAARTTNIDAMSPHAAIEDLYRQNFLTLLNTHPELRALLKERDEAQARYDRERERRSKGRSLSWR